MTTDENKALKKREEALAKLHPREACRAVGLKHHATLLSFFNSAMVFPSGPTLLASMELANWFYISSGSTSHTVARLGKRIGRSRMTAHRDVQQLLDANIWLKIGETSHVGPNRYTLTPHVFALLEEFISANSRCDYLPVRIDSKISYPPSTFKHKVLASVLAEKVTAEDDDSYVESV